MKKRKSLAGQFSPPVIREIVFSLMTGKNYRLIPEDCVRERLFIYSSWLLEIAFAAKKLWGDGWRNKLIIFIFENKQKSEELDDFRMWLIGLTHKTAVNLDIRSDKDVENTLSDLISLSSEIIEDSLWTDGAVSLKLTNGSQNIELTKEESVWLLQVSGALTLTIRGSNKASYGKKLEHSFLRASLEILGLELNKDYWMNIQRDKEVGREADAEIKTRRGRIRVDMGLIGTGNQEVTEDKLGRVGRNGIVIGDKLGDKSKVGKTANEGGVRLIHCRDNFPLQELYEHLQPLVEVKLKKPENDTKWLKKQLIALPDKIFEV